MNVQMTAPAARRVIVGNDMKKAATLAFALTAAVSLQGAPALAAGTVHAVEISPSGKHYMILRDAGDQKALVFHNADDAAEKTTGVGLGPIEVEEVEWGGDDYALVRISQTQTGVRTVDGLKSLDIQRWMSISRLNGDTKRLFGNESGADYFYIVQSSGALLASLPLQNEKAVFANSDISTSAESDSRLKKSQDEFRYSLFLVDLRSGDTKRIASGREDTIDWVVDAEGRPVARIDQRKESGPLEVIALDADGRAKNTAATYSGDDVEKGKPVFLGVGATANSVYLAKDRSAGLTISNLSLDGSGTETPVEAPGGISRISYDPRVANMRLAYYATDSGERSSLRSSNRPNRRMSFSAPLRIASISSSAGGPPPTITVRRLSLPSRVHCITAARSDRRKATSKTAPDANQPSSQTRDITSEALNRNTPTAISVKISDQAASTRPVCIITVR